MKDSLIENIAKFFPDNPNRAVVSIGGEEDH